MEITIKKVSGGYFISSFYKGVKLGQFVKTNTKPSYQTCFDKLMINYNYPHN